MRVLEVTALCAALCGCVSTGDTIAFKTSNPQQQAMMRRPTGPRDLSSGYFIAFALRHAELPFRPAPIDLAQSYL
jgi:hypothetical protein